MIIFSGNGVYHERYNLCTTADVLANPVKRREIVTLTRTVMDIVAEINRDPAVAAEAQAAVAKSNGLDTVEEVALGWPNVKFVASFDEGLLEVLAEEDVGLSAEEKRQPRSREQLAGLIDRSVFDEAKALAART